MRLREKEVERIQLSKTVRENVFKKSEGRCLHCGEQLRFGDRNCTVEHVIPLSKGGTNNEINLVSLCRKCNRNKSNELVHISWYKHASESVLQDIKKVYAEYMRLYSFLDNNHMLPVDRTFYSAELNIKTQDFAENNISKIQRAFIQSAEFEIKRATYRDLEKISQAYKDYMKNRNIKYDDNEIYASVVSLFNCGVIYFYEKNDSVVSVIPVIISKVNMAESSDSRWADYAESDGTSFIPNLIFYMSICLKKQEIYNAMVLDVLLDISKMFMEVLDVTSIPIVVMGYRDKKLYPMLNRVFNILREDSNTYFILAMLYLGDGVDYKKLRESMGVLSSDKNIKFYALNDIATEVNLRKGLYEREV